MSKDLVNEGFKLIENINITMGKYSIEEGDVQLDSERIIYGHLARLSQIINELEIYVNKASPETRNILNKKRTELVYDRNFLKTSFAELRITKNDHHVNLEFELQDIYETKIRVAHGTLDKIMQTGRCIVSSLRTQKGFIKRAKNQLHDIDTKLGLSGKLMRIIGTRGMDDTKIFYILTFITIVLIILLLILIH
ncbi:hypothetical protein HZS_2915 [Henneguya salminicola]|nr:hypothetical protein HZS_2915 [Henneguya salminicola]